VAVQHKATVALHSEKTANDTLHRPIHLEMHIEKGNGQPFEYISTYDFELTLEGI
jgi:hypothetical protein